MVKIHETKEFMRYFYSKFIILTLKVVYIVLDPNKLCLVSNKTAFQILENGWYTFLRLKNYTISTLNLKDEYAMLHINPDYFCQATRHFRKKVLV